MHLIKNSVSSLILERSHLSTLTTCYAGYNFFRLLFIFSCGRTYTETMKSHSHLSIRMTLPMLLAATLLSSCAPAPQTTADPASAPVVAPNQFATIQQQQQIHAEQLHELQQQLMEVQQPLEKGAVTLEELQAEPESPYTSASATIYLTAFSDLACGRMEDAEQGFSAFLFDNPEHQYAANARYWLANAQIALNETDAAIINLNLIINNPSATHKAPAALAQLARIYRQQGDEPQAGQLIKQLRSRYPDSSEARLSLSE
jgi:tol-pal system protein YbgF